MHFPSQGATRSIVILILVASGCLIRPASSNAANKPPTISGSPAATATVGVSYSFVPTAADPEGKALTFSVQNKPAWASFSKASGRLSGTPSASHVGTFRNIAIRVSDGLSSTSLPSFTVTVQGPQLGSATLNWAAPTKNTDGSPLTNLKGYRIHYGMSLGNLDQMVDIPDPGVSSAVIEGLTSGTWYFALKAYNTSNAESALSNTALKSM